MSKKDVTKGKLTVYKKIFQRLDSNDGNRTYYIVELEIPARARRVFPSGHDYKARAEYAIVKRIWRQKIAKGRKCGLVEITTPGFKVDHPGFHEAVSLTYTLGKRVNPDWYDGSSKHCSSGINFFLSIKKAKAYT